MSDLTATNCGCNNSCGNGTSNTSGLFGGNNCIWLILLLLFCGGNGCGSNGISLLSGNGCGNDGNSCCEWIIWLLILSSICGGSGSGCGNNGYTPASNGCGCGC